MSRLDIMQPRAGGDGKTYWTKLGSAWPNKQGVGYSLSFDALPLPSMSDKGVLECRVLLREPLPPRDGAGSARSAAATDGRFRRTAFDDDLNDDPDSSVPF